LKFEIKFVEEFHPLEDELNCDQLIVVQAAWNLEHGMNRSKQRGPFKKGRNK